MASASWYPDKLDHATLLVSGEWTVSLKKYIRFVSHNLLNLALQFILLVSVSLMIPSWERKKKIYNEIIFSLEATPVPWVSAWKAELFNLFALPRGLEMHWLSQGILSSAKSTQKPMIFSKLLVNSLTLSLFLCFSFFPPSLPEAGMRRITVQSPTLLWSEQVSPHIMSK